MATNLSGILTGNGPLLIDNKIENKIK